MWMDADAIICGDLENIKFKDFDIAVTALSKLKLCACPVIVNNTRRATKFMKAYIEAADEAPRGDMYGLRAHFDKYHELSTTSLGSIVDIDGVRVKVLDSMFYLHKIRDMDDIKKIPDYVEIVHFSGRGTRAKRDKEKLALMKRYALIREL